jgi:hypothetical protein
METFVAFMRPDNIRKLFSSNSCRRLERVHILADPGLRRGFDILAHRESESDEMACEEFQYCPY